MGLGCSDGKKSAKNIYTIEHFSSYYEEVPEGSCSSCLQTIVIQSGNFKHQERKKLWNVSLHTNSARFKYYDNEAELKTTCVEKKFATFVGRGRARQTLSNSKLKTTTHCARERIRFQKGRGFVGRTTDSCDHDSPGHRGSETESSTHVSPFSSRTLKKSSGKMKSETSMISSSPRPIKKEFRDKLYEAETYKPKAITNDSMFSLGNALNMKLSEIVALGESRSLGAHEPTTQMVEDEHDKV